MNTFNLLTKDVQQAIWDMGWHNFRTIQDQSINIIINTNNHLVISAPTASGKTEAAFLPLISRYFNELLKSMSILYISPLKALINDQFNRITTLCEKTNINISKWHGDVASSIKKKIIIKPNGILMITPESIEALLLEKEIEARKLFGNLKCIVIDEIHSFLSGERGIHLFSLLKRIEITCGLSELRKVALSATIGDLDSVKAWLCSDSSMVEVIKDNDDTKKDVFGDVIAISGSEKDFNIFPKELFNLTKAGKTLVFSNNKKSLEDACDQMKKYTSKIKCQDIYRIHHGSLSKEIRESTENELKESNNLCVFCTNTLELGIDIGDIDRIVLLAPPWTVSSFIQRIGRSGRIDSKAIKFIFLFEPVELNSDSCHKDNLQIEIIKAIAIIELYLAGYCESYIYDLSNYSCLIHELLAYIKQRGGCPAKDLFQVIIQNSFNEIITIDDFIKLLNHLKITEYIEQFDNGDILLAKKGEKLVENYKFYAVFQTPDQWSIVYKGALIGELPFILFYNVGDQILLGGQRWEIISIEEKTKRIIVNVSMKKKEVVFQSGFGVTSKIIHQKMKEIYENRKIPKYVNDTTITLMEGAFRYYHSLKQNNKLLLHFQGGKIGNTIQVLLKSENIAFEDFEVGIEINKYSLEYFFNTMHNTNISYELFIKFICNYSKQEKYIYKYDYLLPDFLLDREYIHALIDIDGLQDYLHNETGYKKN